MTGYSGTPLAKKLGLKPGFRVFVANAPANYRSLLEPLPKQVTFVRAITATTDLVHMFATSRTALAAGLEKWLPKLKPDAANWVSWPKKASKAPTDITEDTIREIALPFGLVDNKVCAVDETWSGLRLVLRLENRPRRLSK
jgi:hypothetical protein